MKKSSQPAVERSLDLSFLDVGRLLGLRSYFVIALVIPFFVGIHWCLSYIEMRQGEAFPRIVEEMELIRMQAEEAMRRGKQRVAVRLPQAGSLVEGQQRYEVLRKDVTDLIDTLQVTGPRGLASDETAEIERRYQRVRHNLLQLRKWAFGPPLRGHPAPIVEPHGDLPTVIHLAQRHRSQPPAQLQQQLEACKLAAW